MLRNSQVTWPGRAREPCAGANAGGGEPSATPSPAGFCQGATTQTGQPGLLQRWPGLQRRWPRQAGTQPTPPQGRFPARLVSRRSAPARGRAVGATAGEGRGAPEACAPLPEPPQAGSAAAPPLVPLPHHQADRLALGRSPARPRCHQAQGCSPAAQTASALPPNGCPGAGAPPPVLLGRARPPAKVTGGRRPSRSRERPRLERHCDGLAVSA